MHTMTIFSYGKNALDRKPLQRAITLLEELDANCPGCPQCKEELTEEDMDRVMKIQRELYGPHLDQVQRLFFGERSGLPICE